MSNEAQTTSTRRSGPHAPQPNAAQTAAEPALDADDPRARAAKRAAELREHLGGSMDEGHDQFYIDPAIIPDGWTYEYKRLEVLGKPDPSYQVTLRRNGWEPVPASRHPELMPPGWSGETIIRDGMILMERPKEITDEIKARDARLAREQVRAKEQQLNAAPPGQFERDNKGNSMVSIKKTMAIPVPEK